MEVRSTSVLRRVAGLALLGGLLLGWPAAAQVHSPYGINVHAPAGAARDRLLSRVEEAGIGWIRIDFLWAFIEPLPGLYDWRLYDELVASAEERGIEVLAIIGFTPAWATDGEELAGVPLDPDDWARFCTRAAARYRDRIRHWEIWNEPNLPQFWSGSRELYLEQILIPAARAIRGAAPGARVGGPGLAHLSSRDWFDWLRETLARAGSELDFLTHHAYDADGHREVTAKLEEITPFGDLPELWDVIAPSLREVLDEAGWGERPVWLTETGWGSDVVGEEAQAVYVDGLLEQWLGGDPERSWLDKIFIYELEDDPTSGVTRFGLLDASGTAKPAYRAVRDFIDRHPVAGGDPTLELADGRFAVEVRFEDRRGRRRSGSAVPFSELTGQFWFFDPENVELVVKVLDGRSFNDHFWVFYGALSDVEYWLSVHDRETGATRRYHNPPGTLCGRGDTVALPATGTPPLPPEVAMTPTLASRRSGCLADETALCLQSDRFRVEVEWRDQHNRRQGVGQALPGTADTGAFWFFDPDNVELAVKVLDGREVNGHFWVFYGALSDVEYRVQVTDTETGAVRPYRNPPGTLCGRGDVAAF